MRESTLGAGLYWPKSEHRVTDGLEIKGKWRIAGSPSQSFEVFVTTDRNLSFQQNVQSLGIGVVVMTAHTNRSTDLQTCDQSCQLY